MEHEYSIDITLKFTELLTAKNKAEAIEVIKDIYAERYNIKLTNKEIEKIERIY